MDPKKDLLLRTATRLCSLGEELERAKEKIRKLHAAGAELPAPEMVQAATHCAALQQQWDTLEQEYLRLRDEIQSK